MLLDYFQMGPYWKNCFRVFLSVSCFLKIYYLSLLCLVLHVKKIGSYYTYRCVYLVAWFNNEKKNTLRETCALT